MNVADIKVAGAGGYGDVYMQSMGSSGSFEEKQYFYLTMDGMGVEDGWYRDVDGTDPVDDTDTIKFGYGMSFASDGAVTITYSGAVVSGVPTVTWEGGYGFLANPTPIDQKINDIIVEGAGGYGDVTFQKLLPSGSFDSTEYFYLTMDGMGVEDGWYMDVDGTMPVEDSDVIAAGQSVSFHSDGELTVTFKKVLN